MLNKLKNLKLSNDAYNVLKWIAITFIPAFEFLYSTLSKIWGWPYAVEVVGSIAAVGVFLAAILGISTANYNKEIESGGE